MQENNYLLHYTLPSIPRNRKSVLKTLLSWNYFTTYYRVINENAVNELATHSSLCACVRVTLVYYMFELHLR